MSKLSDEFSDEFISACQKNDITYFKRWIKSGVDTNFQDDKGRTALYWAIKHDHEEFVDLLINYGASILIEVNRWTGRTAIAWAADYGSGKCINVLMMHGAEVDFKEKNGDTPLIAAAQAGHAGCMKILIGYGAFVDPVNRFRETAVMVSAQSEDSGMDCLLVLAGAGANIEPLQDEYYNEYRQCKAVQELAEIKAVARKSNQSQADSLGFPLCQDSCRL